MLGMYTTSNRIRALLVIWSLISKKCTKKKVVALTRRSHCNDKTTKSEEENLFSQIVLQSEAAVATILTPISSSFHPQQIPCFHMLKNNASNLSIQHQLPYPTPPDFLINLLQFPTNHDIHNSSLSFENLTHTTTPHSINEFGRKRRGGKRTKHVTGGTERQRRADLSVKFDALKDLIPNLTKRDRASVVGDAIEYIRELMRTVDALKSLVEDKKCEKQRMVKRIKVEERAVEGELGEDSNYNKSFRSCWTQRKTKDIEVDVRIVDNEVTVKLVQRKKVNCLVYISHFLDEFKLLLQYVASSNIGDFCSYFINSKICEGSTVYPSAIANKLIEVMDTSLAAP